MGGGSSGTRSATSRSQRALPSAIIASKVEYTITGPDGESKETCSLWVTRNGWRNDGEKWRMTYSEAVGHESWKPGIKPPIPGW